MKYIRIYIIVMLFIGLGGCDSLSYDENAAFSKEDIFGNFANTQGFLNNIYHRLSFGFNTVDGAMRASATSNAVEVSPLSAVHDFTDGSWNAINTVDDQWAHLYGGIQAANDFLENFEISNYDDIKYNDNYNQVIQQAETFPYQARFLRAFFYFRLIKRYGHVPLITKTLTAKQANKVKPSTYQEVTEFIVSECDTIAPHLPVTYQNIPSKETGRATKGAALALKAKVLLYAASPLHNPSNDLEKWKKAASAAWEIIINAQYSLESDYSDVVNNRMSLGLIFGRRLAPSNTFEAYNFPVGYPNTRKGGTAPTQNLVNAYEMQKTGLPITNPASGYDPQHPYKDRDPRLKATIIVNNSKWKGRKVELWKGGRDGLPQTGASPTGYYLKKYVKENVNLGAVTATTRAHTWVFFRYAGVLLNYAEAMNEAYGPYAGANMGRISASQAVNLLRAKRGMPDFPPGMSKVAFRKKLHNERRVALAFENQYFWDLRRWKIGPSTTKIKGMKITKNPDGSFTYEVKTIRNRVWNNRMYFYPIPENEIGINSLLKQNKGW